MGSNETISGVVKRIVYSNPDGFIIAKLSNGSTILGELTDPSMVLEYTFTGEWKTHPTYGKQFKFDSYESSSLKDAGSVVAYIQESCRWIGNVTARAIADTYGDKALEILKNDPERVTKEIRGLTLDRATEVSEKLRSIADKEALSIEMKELFLNVPVRKSAIKRMIDMWGTDAPAKIRKDPYILPDEVNGIGFATADIVGQKLGIARDDERRVRGALMHIMKDAAGAQGHTCLPLKEAIEKTINLVSCKREVVANMVEECCSRGQLVAEGTKVYLAKMHRDEVYVAEKIEKLSAHKPDPVAPVLDGLADDQVEAIKACLDHNVVIVTGPAGSGKSFAIKRVLDSLYGHGTTKLAAPTGKAAKRMSEHTNRDAYTIHMLLGPEPRKTKSGKLSFNFKHDETNPLDVDTLVLDETSMLDLPLFASTLRALRPASRLIMIGDVNQLPAVGAGNVLRDMIASKVIHVSNLTKIKRQNPGLLLRNAHAVKDGRDISVVNEDPDGDFYFMGLSVKRNIQNEICDLVESRLPAKYGFDSVRDIQVLSPFREKTVLSCKALNSALQKRLNPKGKPVGKTIFRAGDKVIQKRNDYSRKIVNGDIGIVKGEAGSSDKQIVVLFNNPERKVLIPMYENNLHLAYALTIHSSQGSEWPAVVIPIHTSFGSLIMQRPLAYTAITRAQRLCVMIGEMKAMRATIKRNRPIKRYTTLAQRLRGEISKALAAGAEMQLEEQKA